MAILCPNLTPRDRFIALCMVLGTITVRSFQFGARSVKTRPNNIRSSLVRPRPSTIVSKRMSDSASPDDDKPMVQLIDVDCNLWHNDLRAFLSAEPGIAVESEPEGELMSNPWNFLGNDNISGASSEIIAMVSPCSTLTESRRAVATLEKHFSEQTKPSSLCQIGTTLGIHPYHVNDDDLQGLSGENPILACMEELKSLYSKALDVASENESKKMWVIAAGECGLDQAPGFPPLEEQLPWFEAQVNLAKELNLPLFVHERMASEQTLQVLDALDRDHKVLIHCFTGNAREAQVYLERGYSISLAGGFLAKKDAGENAKDVCNALPSLWPLLRDKLMLETDAPYMGFSNARSKYLEKHSEVIAALPSKKRKRIASSTYPNVPSSLESVLDMVHEAVNSQKEIISREELAALSTHNAKCFFGFS